MSDVTLVFQRQTCIFFIFWVSGQASAHISRGSGTNHNADVQTSAPNLTAFAMRTPGASGPARISRKDRIALAPQTGYPERTGLHWRPRQDRSGRLKGLPEPDTMHGSGLTAEVRPHADPVRLGVRMCSGTGRRLTCRVFRIVCILTCQRVQARGRQATGIMIGTDASYIMEAMIRFP